MVLLGDMQQFLDFGLWCCLSQACVAADADTDADAVWHDMLHLQNISIVVCYKHSCTVGSHTLLHSLAHAGSHAGSHAVAH